MPVVSVRLNEEEAKIFKSYANLHGISLSEAYKKALYEKIEDEFDLAEIAEATEEFNKNSKTYSLEELKNKYDL